MSRRNRGCKNSRKDLEKQTRVILITVFSHKLLRHCKRLLFPKRRSVQSFKQSSTHPMEFQTRARSTKLLRTDERKKRQLHVNYLPWFMIYIYIYMRPSCIFVGNVKNEVSHPGHVVESFKRLNNEKELAVKTYGISYGRCFLRAYLTEKRLRGISGGNKEPSAIWWIFYTSVYVANLTQSVRQAREHKTTDAKNKV